MSDRFFAALGFAAIFLTGFGFGWLGHAISVTPVP